MPRNDGWVGAIDQRAKQVAEILNERRKKALQSAGAPWRHEEIGEKPALQRIAEWNQPDEKILKQAAQLSDREAVSAALDAVKRIQRAEKKGLWVPGVGPVAE